LPPACVSFDVLLHELKSAYFVSDLPLAEEDKRRLGCSRDPRQAHVRVVIGW
jgi:hypothetical protein